ncbi:MAG: ABC transporter substrate-binding protein [Rhodospirillales bacterium]|jgi:peptide/nickel transport system substrate-binding protein
MTFRYIAAKLQALAFASLFAASAAFAQTPVSGGNLTIAFPANQEPASLDGHIDPFQSTWLFNSFIADPLVILDADAVYKPALALSWELSPDSKIWTFKLRPGVRFQDGTPFNAAAVKFNVERIVDPRTASKQLASEIGPVKSVEVVDDMTVRFVYDQAWVTLLDGLRRTPIWSPTAAQRFSLADFQRNLVGTGPFTLAEWITNDRMVFRRWADYGGWNSASAQQGPAYLDSVTIRFIGENAVLNEAVRAGTTLVGFTLTPDARDIYKDKPNFVFLSRGQSGTGLHQVMNIRNPPLSDIRVRQALLFARDSAALNRLLYDGTYIPSDGPLDNVHPCFWPGASAMYQPNLDRARQLLDEAGWRTVPGQPIRQARGVPGVADGTPLRVRWSTIHHREIGEAMQQQLRRVGVDLAVELLPGPIQLDRVNRRDFDLMFLRQRSPDPVILDQVWNSRWDQPGGWAWTGYKGEELDRTVAQLRVVSDQGARCEAARNAQKIIMDNALVFPTLSQPVFIAMSPRVQNFRMGSEGNWFFLHSTWIQR